MKKTQLADLLSLAVKEYLWADYVENCRIAGTEVDESKRPILEIIKILEANIDRRSVKTDEMYDRIEQAARRKNEGATWDVIAEEFGESFAKDLRTRNKEDFKVAKKLVTDPDIYLSNHGVVVTHELDIFDGDVGNVAK